MPNPTHRKRLARAYAQHAGITYMAALAAVTEAAKQGRLPSRLDEAGMQASLRILTSGGSVTPETVKALLAGASNGADSRVRVYAKKATDPKDQPIFDASARYEHLTGKQGLMYISAPGGKNERDRYAFGGGHVALGRAEALSHINNLLTEALVGAAERQPYVGEGADGARRSAQIDWEETDQMDAEDPRLPEVVASAQRWQRQADFLDLATAPVEISDACQHPTREYRAQEGLVCTDCNTTLIAHAEHVATGKFHLELPYLRLLRQVWQGRVTRTRLGSGRVVFTIDNTPTSDLKDIELRWLDDNGYLSAPLMAGEEWAIARTTDFGDDTLAFHGADRDKFTDGLPSPAAPRRLTHDDIQRCPVRSLSPSHYNADGTCQCPPAPSAPNGDAVAQVSVENPYQNFDISGTVQADVRSLLKVHQAFLDAGRVQWSWHRGDFKGEHGFKIVEGINDAGELVLRDENPNATVPVTTLSLDYIDDPDKAARHLVWPQNSGVTFKDKVTGEIDATYRVAGPKTETPTGPKPIRRVVRSSTTLNPATARLMGGPTTAKVIDARGHRVNATCDVCERQLKTNEPWWMVHAPGRGWDNNAGVSCSAHSPATLPLWEDNNIEDPLTDGEKVLLELLHKRGGRMHVAGIPECRRALTLTQRGLVQIESGNISVDGGSGVISVVQTAPSEAARQTDPEAVNGTDNDVSSVPTSVSFAHEGNPVARCDATSWRAGSGQRAGDGFGPGGFNRCVRKARHESERHIDEWGNVFELDPKFRVIKHLTPGAVARTALKDGVVVFAHDGNPLDAAALDAIFPYQATDEDDLNDEVRAKLRENLLVQTRQNEVLKISTLDKDSLTAQVVYPLPPRTTVRHYTYKDAATWREPSTIMMNKYEEAWGFSR